MLRLVVRCSWRSTQQETLSDVSDCGLCPYEVRARSSGSTSRQQAEAMEWVKLLEPRSFGRAKNFGYSTMYLDTLPGMEAAQSLYRNLGFEQTSPYYRAPFRGMLFYRLEIAA